MRQQSQKDKLPHSLVYPTLHPGLIHKNNGLFSIAPICANTLLISCQSEQVIRIQTVPSFIRSLPKLDEHNQIALYVLLLKNSDGQMDRQLKEWLSCKTMGFVGVQDRLIRECGDQQLLIEYTAYKFHYKEQASKLYQQQPIKLLLQKYTRITTIQQFTLQWIEACQFKNTRSFGHTDQYLLIPAIDYLNYDPALSCDKVKFVTFDKQEEIHDMLLHSQSQAKIKDINLKQESVDQTTSEEQQQVQQKTKRFVGICSVKPIEPEEEILFDYGGLSNYQLFRHYGYAVRNNPNDYVTIYVTNYFRQNPIFYSAVERCTTKFKLYAHKINYKLIEHWVKIDKDKNTFDRSEKIKDLIFHMKNNTPPRLSQQKCKQLSQLNGFQYLIIYQQEQYRVYRENISLMVAQVEKTQIQTPEKLVLKGLT